MREYQVRICERLRVKFPGPTRQTPEVGARNLRSAFPPGSDIVGPISHVRKVRHQADIASCPKGAANNGSGAAYSITSSA